MTKPLYEDPIVAEIQAIRQSLLDDCGGDIDEYRKGARQRQSVSGRCIITKPFRDRTEQKEERETSAQSVPNGK